MMYKFKFQNDSHKRKFTELLKKDDTFYKDCERMSLFFLLSLDTLENKADKVYDFDNNWIITEGLDDIYTTSARMLTRLGFNLYNSYKDDFGILDILTSVGVNNYEYAMIAIDMRINYERYEHEIKEICKENNISTERRPTIFDV